MREKIGSKVKCRVCGKEFRKRYNNQKDCSIECRKISYIKYQEEYRKDYREIKVGGNR